MGMSLCENAVKSEREIVGAVVGGGDEGDRSGHRKRSGVLVCI